MNTRQWLISVISYYRNLEFFQQYSSLSDDRIADILENIQKNNEFDNGTFNSQREEDVIVLDENRIIPLCLEDIYIEHFNSQEDIEILNKISNANKIIKGILLELSYISREIFIVKNIQCLSYKNGIASVKFIFDRIEHLVDLEVIDDPSLAIGTINPILKNTNYQFEILNLVEEQFLVMLTLQEKQKLQKEKNWLFLDSNSEYENQEPKKHSHPLIQKICLIAESVSLGSESGDPVQIYFTQAESYQAACEEFFNPKDEISYMTLKEFESSYLDECCCEDDSLENMITTFKKLNAACGAVTPEGYINAIEEYGTRGSFYICFFINLIEEVNTNIFIAFPRYEG